MISVKETAKRFDITERRVQKLCELGRIPGAIKSKNVWLIPDNAKKPSDERYLSTVEDMLSPIDFCNLLSISMSTCRNWIKTGKIKPDLYVKDTPYFTYEHLEEIKKTLLDPHNTMLKSRRNKKYVSGKSIYKSYISSDSSNYLAVKRLFEQIDKLNIDVDDDLMVALIADCAFQLIMSKMENSASYMFLIEDILSLRLKKQKINIPTIEYNFEESEDILGLLYMSLRNISYKKALGEFFTPDVIIDKLLLHLFEKNPTEGKRILDPCCGTGNFLMRLPDSIDGMNVYGNDLNPLCVRIARVNYAVKYKVCDRDTIYEHITEKDFLSFSGGTKYDYIIGNPPWGYFYSETDKERLEKVFRCAKGKYFDSFELFCEQALKCLEVGGASSYVLPEAFINVKSHQEIRKIILEELSPQYVECLGDVFDHVHCPSIILQVKYTGKPHSVVGLEVNDGKRIFTVQMERGLSSEEFSLCMTDDEYRITQKIANVKNKLSLRDNAIFALGIVTGNNKELLDKEKNDSNEVVLKGCNVFKYGIECPDTFIHYLPEKFQQCADDRIYRAKEKLLYRFICNKLVFAYDDKQTLSLNSCNILIPTIPNMNMKYVLAVLNSRISQFYFYNKFHSIKVLRSHLEQIPIPYVDDKTQDEIVGLVDLIMKASSIEETKELYDRIDRILCDVFELSKEEYDIILEQNKNDKTFLYL